MTSEPPHGGPRDSGHPASGGKGLLADHRARYIVVGLVVLATNLSVAHIVFRFPLFVSSPLWRNAGNILVTEVAVITAFFLHRRFTWASDDSRVLRAILRFHAVTGIGLIARLLTFGVLDGQGVGPMIATVLSIPIVIVVNYFGYDRLVFAKLKASPD